MALGGSRIDRALGTPGWISMAQHGGTMDDIKARRKYVQHVAAVLVVASLAVTWATVAFVRYENQRGEAIFLFAGTLVLAAIFIWYFRDSHRRALSLKRELSLSRTRIADIVDGPVLIEGRAIAGKVTTMAPLSRRPVVGYRISVTQNPRPWWDESDNSVTEDHSVMNDFLVDDGTGKATVMAAGALLLLSRERKEKGGILPEDVRQSITAQAAAELQRLKESFRRAAAEVTPELFAKLAKLGGASSEGRQLQLDKKFDSCTERLLEEGEVVVVRGEARVTFHGPARQVTVQAPAAGHLVIADRAQSLLVGSLNLTSDIPDTYPFDFERDRERTDGRG